MTSNKMVNALTIVRLIYHYDNCLFSDTEYSKLSLGPLFSEIFDHILPVVNDDEEKEDRGRPPAKLGTSLLGFLSFCKIFRRDLSNIVADNVLLLSLSQSAIYSGHDSTVMQVLSALGPNVWDGSEWPAYASMILIEVRVVRSARSKETNSNTERSLQLDVFLDAVY